MEIMVVDEKNTVKNISQKTGRLWIKNADRLPPNAGLDTAEVVPTQVGVYGKPPPAQQNHQRCGRENRQ